MSMNFFKIVRTYNFLGKGFEASNNRNFVSLDFGLCFLMKVTLNIRSSYSLDFLGQMDYELWKII